MTERGVEDVLAITYSSRSLLPVEFELLKNWLGGGLCCRFDLLPPEGSLDDLHTPT